MQAELRFACSTQLTTHPQIIGRENYDLRLPPREPAINQPNFHMLPFEFEDLRPFQLLRWQPHPLTLGKCLIFEPPLRLVSSQQMKSWTTLWHHIGINGPTSLVYQTLINFTLCQKPCILNQPELSGENIDEVISKNSKLKLTRDGQNSDKAFFKVFKAPKGQAWSWSSLFTGPCYPPGAKIPFDGSACRRHCIDQSHHSLPHVLQKKGAAQQV